MIKKMLWVLFWADDAVVALVSVWKYWHRH
jgi:hypothetical protein